MQAYQLMPDKTIKPLETRSLLKLAKGRIIGESPKDILWIADRIKGGLDTLLKANSMFCPSAVIEMSVFNSIELLHFKRFISGKEFVYQSLGGQEVVLHLTDAGIVTKENS